MKDNEQRVTELEISLAHLQRQYDLLNEVVTEQAGELSRLTKRIAKWEQTVDSLKAAMEESADIRDEKPPHY